VVGSGAWREGRACLARTGQDRQVDRLPWPAAGQDGAQLGYGGVVYLGGGVCGIIGSLGASNELLGTLGRLRQQQQQPIRTIIGTAHRV
jgi:hypothetical protein